jgi:hypothetical protein
MRLTARAIPRLRQGPRSDCSGNANCVNRDGEAGLIDGLIEGQATSGTYTGVSFALHDFSGTTSSGASAGYNNAYMTLCDLSCC